jgi:hypothetical protein
VVLLEANKPLSPGPIFFSLESALWQALHCSNTSFPLAASPLAPNEGAMAKANPHINKANVRMTGD